MRVPDHRTTFQLVLVGLAGVDAIVAARWRTLGSRAIQEGAVSSADQQDRGRIAVTGRTTYHRGARSEGSALGEREGG